MWNHWRIGADLCFQHGIPKKPSKTYWGSSEKIWINQFANTINLRNLLSLLSLVFLAFMPCSSRESKPCTQRMMVSSTTALSLVQERHLSWRPLWQLKGEGRKDGERGEGKARKTCCKKKFIKNKAVSLELCFFLGLDLLLTWTSTSSLTPQFKKHNQFSPDSLNST